MSGRVRVVRMEKNGRGPFQGIMRRGGELYNLIYDQLSKGDHVSCTIEGKGFRGLEGYLFACETEDDLYEYFGEAAIRYMLDDGYDMKWYEVEEDRIVYGRGELAFLPTQAQASTHYYPPKRYEPIRYEDSYFRNIYMNTFVEPQEGKIVYFSIDT